MANAAEHYMAGFLAREHEGAARLRAHLGNYPLTGKRKRQLVEDLLRDLDECPDHYEAQYEAEELIWADACAHWPQLGGVYQQAMRFWHMGASGLPIGMCWIVALRIHNGYTLEQAIEAAK